MKVVLPETKTSLLINRNFEAFAFCTARAAIRHLITERVKGIDAVGNVVSWSGTDLPVKQTNVLRWYNNEVALLEDQPCLRSAPDTVTGKERFWAIPTILVCNHTFGIHRKIGNYVSLRVLYSTYKGICQYCLEKVPYQRATKDHIYPKSKGGTNDDFNLILSCKSCNGDKDNTYPYFNVKGKPVRPIKINGFALTVKSLNYIREEWKPFIGHLVE